MTSIGEIVRQITVELSRDRAFEAWAKHEPDVSRIPPPSLFAKCRAIGASDALMIRLIHRLAFEGKLAGYAQDDGEPFFGLCRFLVQTEAA